MKKFKFYQNIYEALGIEFDLFSSSISTKLKIQYTTTCPRQHEYSEPIIPDIMHNKYIFLASIR